MVRARRKLAHIDLDQFYVAVERLRNPELHDKPVLVGGGPRGRGVVASASYEARRYGIHSAMPMTTALRLCPDALIVRSSFSDYKEHSMRVFGIVGDYTALLERVSIDEGYMDIGGCERYHGKSGFEMIHEMRERIYAELGLTISAGISTSRMMAKIASEFAKPCGMLEVIPGYEKEFLSPLGIRKIPGVGPRTEERLKELGIEKIGDIHSIRERLLKKKLGVFGTALKRKAMGYSSSTLRVKHGRKSVGHQRTFAEDVIDMDKMLGTLHYLAERACNRLRKSAKIARVVTLKVRYSDFTTITRSSTLKRSTDRDEAVFRMTKALAEMHIQKGRKIRLVGVSLSGLTDKVRQIEMFVDTVEKEVRANAASDKVRERYDFRAVMTAESLGVNRGQDGKDNVRSEMMFYGISPDGWGEG